MRLLIILLAFISLTGCSIIPESWKFDTEFWTSDNDSVAAETIEKAEATEEEKPAKEIELEFNANQIAKVQVGQTKDEVLEILGPAVNVDHGVTLADHYVKGGEVYDVLYFRAEVNGVEDIRALLFKANQLIGIGWSEVN
jgi:hypothetical protein